MNTYTSPFHFQFSMFPSRNIIKTRSLLFIDHQYNQYSQIRTMSYSLTIKDYADNIHLDDLHFKTVLNDIRSLHPTENTLLFQIFIVKLDIFFETTP